MRMAGSGPNPDTDTMPNHSLSRTGYLVSLGLSNLDISWLPRLIICISFSGLQWSSQCLPHGWLPLSPNGGE